MEEACKAAALSIFYIRFYNLTKLEDSGNFTKIKKIPIGQHINMINSMFLSHEFKVSDPVIMGVVSEIGKEVYDKVMPEHLKKRGVTGEKAKEIINEAKALLDSFVIESIPSRIKERGFYVDFDFNELKLSLPTEVTEKDSTTLQNWISVYLDVVKEFLEFFEKES